MQEGEQNANENGLSFLETSAKTAHNVNELFYEIGKFYNLFQVLTNIFPSLFS